MLVYNYDLFFFVFVVVVIIKTYLKKWYNNFGTLGIRKTFLKDLIDGLLRIMRPFFKGFSDKKKVSGCIMKCIYNYELNTI